MINEPVEEILEIDLREIFSKLMKHRRLIIDCILACVAIALLYSFIAHPVYKSTARILVEGKPPKITKVENVILPDYADRIDDYNSQVEILKSHSIASLVYDELGSYKPWGSLRGRRPEKLLTKEESIEALLKTIHVSPVRMTQIIEIKAEDVDPVLAAKIVNTWVNAYIVFSSLDQFIQRKAELEADLEQNLKYVKEKHPIIQGLRSEIETIDAKISGEKQKVFNSKEPSFSFIKEDQKITNVKILDSARIAKKPVRPKLLVNLLFAFFIGTFGGLGIALLLESINQSIKVQADIESFLHLTCFSSVPVYSQENKKENFSPMLVSAKDNNSMFAERFRSLRTSIIYSNPDLSKKVLLITSAGPSEGKTTIVVNLATAFAKSEEKTIIIDADLRKPALHTVFDTISDKGITELLAYESMDIKAHVKKTGIINLDFMPCGTIPPNPAELLGSKKIELLIKELLKTYDRIIFDTPPVLAATDAVILSTKVDAAILVFKASFTHKQAAKMALKLIRSVHSKVLGAVLNMIKSEDYSYYSYYNYYSQKDKKV